MKQANNIGKRLGAFLLSACVLMSMPGMAPAAKAQAPEAVPAETEQRDFKLPGMQSGTENTIPAEPENNPDSAAADITAAPANMDEPGETLTDEGEPAVTINAEPDEPLYLPEGQPVAQADLLAGVTAADENGNSVEVTVQDTDGLDRENPAMRGQAEAYLITYAAVHPVSGETFTRTREAYVTVGVMPAASTADIIDLSDSDADLSAGATASGGKYSYTTGIVTVHSGPVTLTGSTTDRQVEVDGTAQITLDNVSIDVSSAIANAALRLENGAEADIILKGNNTLISGDNCAGLQAPSGTTVSIRAENNDNEQTLAATGGEHGAGIGGNFFDVDGGSITIKSGTVTANAGELGAGIGGGYEGMGGSITINGGIVTATAGEHGAGIGGGDLGSGGSITINGGIITARGGSWGAGIGGGAFGPGGNITINGGIITTISDDGGSTGAAGIGGGMGGDGGTITITGGTITVTGDAMGADIGPGAAGPNGTITITGGSVNPTRGLVSPSPTNGTNLVYLNTLTVGSPAIGDDKLIVNMMVDDWDTPYGSNDILTKNGSKLYVWLPQNSTTSAGIFATPENGATYMKKWLRTGTSETGTLLRLGNAQSPQIDSQPTGGTFIVGDTPSLSLTAHVDDGGTLSYQWYQSQDPDMDPFDYPPIPGATAASYTPDTSALGTTYYYCIVTNTNPSIGGTKTAISYCTMVGVTVIDIPDVGSIPTPDAAGAGNPLALTAPAVNGNGDPVTDEGWETSTDSLTWTAFDPTLPVNASYNGQYLRYYATNSAGTGYSNTVQITVYKFNLTLSLSCADISYGETPNPVLAGSTGGGAVTYAYKAQGAPDSDYSAAVPTAVGDYTVQASVAATEVYNPADITADFRITKAVPDISLTASPAGGGSAVDSVTLTAALTGVSPGDSPTGSVVFKNGGTVLGTVSLTNGKAVYTWQNAPAGTHHLTADYAGDSSYESGSASVSGYVIQTKPQKPQDGPVITAAKATPYMREAKLEATATGTAPLSYQWQVKNDSWIDIPGAATAAFNYTGLRENTNYTVRVIVTDADGNTAASEAISFTTGEETPMPGTITGLPKDHNMPNGASVSWTPKPAGGTWSYNKDYLGIRRDGDKVTFTALKAGKTSVTYTVNGLRHTVDITIADPSAPQTGDTSHVLPYLLLAAGSASILGVLIRQKKRKSAP